MASASTDKTGTILLRSSMLLFALGLIAIGIVIVCYASGARDLPFWLDLASGILAPVGLALGLATVIREAKRR